jgi:hypothetical protein
MPNPGDSEESQNSDEVISVSIPEGKTLPPTRPVSREAGDKQGHS